MDDNIIKHFGVDYLDDRDKYLATKFLDLATALSEILPECDDKERVFEDLLRTRRNVIADRPVDVYKPASAPDELDSDIGPHDPADDLEF